MNGACNVVPPFDTLKAYPVLTEPQAKASAKRTNLSKGQGERIFVGFTAESVRIFSAASRLELVQGRLPQPSHRSC